MEVCDKIFISIDEFVSNIENLISKRIVEITEEGHIFRVNSTWYGIYYENNYGMNINLYSGFGEDFIDNYQYSAWVVGSGSPDRIKADNLFKQLKEIYSIHRLCDTTSMVKTLSQHVDFFRQITEIDKLSESSFVLYCGEIRYSIIKRENYDKHYNYVIQCVEITKFENNNIQTISENNDYYSVKLLYSILNTLYSINQLAKYGKFENCILEMFNIQ